MNPKQGREVILKEHPELVGEIWAKGWFQVLRSEGRPVSGGWPGTIQEARMRAREHCDRELGLHSLSPLSHDELQLVAAAIYERAKRDWLRAAREGHVSSERRSRAEGSRSER